MSLVNAELERKVLSLVFQEAGISGCVKASELLEKTGLSPDDLALAQHRTVLTALNVLLKQKRPVTPASVAAVVPGAITSTDVDNIARAAAGEPTDAAKQYAESLRRLAVLRRCSDFFGTVAKKAQAAASDPSLILAGVRRFTEKVTGSIAEYRTCAEDAVILAERLNAQQDEKRLTVVETGIPALDDVIGGFRPTLSVIGGLPGVGKSALIGTLLGHWGKQGIQCGLFGLEDGTEWVTQRLVAREARVSLGDLMRRRLSQEEQNRVDVALPMVSAWMDNVQKCAPFRRMKPVELVERAKDWVLNRGTQIIVIDHIGELDHGNARERYDLSIGDSLSQLRSLAYDYGTIVIVAAHLRRGVEKNKDGRPSLTDFAESSYIEKIARLAIGLYESDTPGVLMAAVLKHTFGRGGDAIELERVPKAALVATGGAWRRQGDLLGVA